MNNNEILERIKNSVNDAPINILDNLKNTKVTKMTEHDDITSQDVVSKNINKAYMEADNKDFNKNDSKKNIFVFNNYKRLMSFTSFAAVFLLVFIGVYQFRIPDSHIYFDINPSISMTTNRRDKVIELKAINEDGSRIIDDIEYKDKDLEEVTEEIIKFIALDSILNGNDVDDNKSVLLLSVYNDNTSKRDSQAKRLDEFIRQKSDSYDIHPFILTQTITESNTINEFAERYGISIGKMTFIRNLMILDPELKLEELVNLSLYELLEISINTGINIDEIVNSGNDERLHPSNATESLPQETLQEEEAKPLSTSESKDKLETKPIKPSQGIDDDDRSTETSSSTKGILSKAKASELAIAEIGGGRVVDIELDDGEYEIEIYHNGYEYDIEMDAYSGKIKDIDKDEIDDDDDDIRTETSSPTKGIISKAKASELALARVGGGRVVKIELDDGEYEIEIYHNGYEYDIEMDAYTGQITDIDDEEIDDD